MSGRSAAVVAVAGLVVLGAGQGVINRHAIEHRLTRASAGALHSAGVTGASVSFRGRDAEIVVAGPPADRARSAVIVSAVPGVRVAHARAARSSVPASTPPAPSTAPPPDRGTAGIPPVGLTFTNGVVTMSGTVSSAAVDAGIKAVLGGSGRWAVIDRLQVNAAIEPAGADWIRSLGGLATTIPANTTLVVARYDEGRVIMRGAPATPALERDILRAAAVTVGSSPAKVTDGLDVP